MLIYQHFENLLPSCHWHCTDTETGDCTISMTPKAEWENLSLEEKLIVTKLAFIDPLAPSYQSQFESSQ